MHATFSQQEPKLDHKSKSSYTSPSNATSVMKSSEWPKSKLFKAESMDVGTFNANLKSEHELRKELKHLSGNGMLDSGMVDAQESVRHNKKVDKKNLNKSSDKYMRASDGEKMGQTDRRSANSKHSGIDKFGYGDRSVDLDFEEGANGGFYPGANHNSG